MKHLGCTLYTSLLCLTTLGPVVNAASASMVDRYNVAWTMQSENSADSMPCVGGDMGCNVWVEDNKLLFYVGRAGCRDENGSLLKMGRVRIAIDPSPFADGARFSQTLKLREGLVEIDTEVPGQNAATIQIWVEIGRPVVHAEIETSERSTVVATYENWRTEPIELPNTGKNLHRGQCLINYDNYPEPVFVYPDAFRQDETRIRFWHQMREDKNVFHHLIKTQTLEPIKQQLVDPCRNLVFGGEMTGRTRTTVGEEPFVAQATTKGEYALTPFKGWSYRSPLQAQKHRIDIVTLIRQTESIEQWHGTLDTKVEDLKKTDLVEVKEATRKWWQDFWERSYLVINPEKHASDTGWRLARNYNLFRYMLASGLHGREPIMFNGGVLTFDPIFAKSRHQGPGYTPDHRQWGSALTAQNQRCMYWPMLKTGDFDLIIPGFDFYRDGLNNAQQRVRHYWGHDGCAFTEQTTIQALPGAMVYGYQGEKYKGKTWRYRPDSLEPGVAVNGAVNRLYESQLEWSWMILQYHQFTGHDISQYMPLIEQSVIFYDEHYRMRERQRTGQPLTADGRLYIKPSNTLEGHPGGANPTSVIAGLRQVLTQLSRLPERYTSVKMKKRWQDMLERLPDMPRAVVDGHTVLRPTADHASHSWHMPSMYPLYPYQMFQLGRPGLELMRATFLHGIKENARQDYRAWNQGVVHYAHLGMTEAARELIIKKLDDGPYRFPAFWPPLIDWAPDHNWGGMGMIGLQEMLMQTFDDRILLLPAWPQDWDVEFRLHAPGQTTVEAKVVNAQMAKLDVSPADRKKDIEIWKKDQSIDPEKASVEKPGAFAASWESLENYECPAWFRDAKLGIFVCWNLHSVQGMNDWYCYNMYREGHPVYQHHVKTYGHPSTFGFKDFIPLWRGEKFDAQDLVRRFKDAGAKYVVPIATFHDNFDCWNSRHHRWNAYKMGPKKDIMGLWKEACEHHGLRFGCTTHLARSLCWMQWAHGADKQGPLAGVPYDGADPQYQDFYHPKHGQPAPHYPPEPTQAWKDQWTARLQDLCEQHRPDLLYFDGCMPFPDDDGLTGRKLVAWYYNQNMKWHDGRLEAVMNIKKWPIEKLHGPYRDGTCVRDMERGLLTGIQKDPWQNDTTVSKWFYQPNAPVRSVNSTVDMLVDIVSKNGNLLLNIPPRPDGSLDAAHQQHLVDLGKWMKVNGQAIYGTRPWRQFGEGPTAVKEGHFGDDRFTLTSEDIRFTRSKDDNTVYAIQMDWPGNGAEVAIRALGTGSEDRKIRSVSMLGHGGPLTWTRDQEALTVTLPKEKPCNHAFSLKIELAESRQQHEETEA